MVPPPGRGLVPSIAAISASTPGLTSTRPATWGEQGAGIGASADRPAVSVTWSGTARAKRGGKGASSFARALPSSFQPIAIAG